MRPRLQKQHTQMGSWPHGPPVPATRLQMRPTSSVHSPMLRWAEGAGTRGEADAGVCVMSLSRSEEGVCGLLSA
jgi:hypothetical protein